MMVLLCLLGLSISLAMRVNLSVAIVDMVNETAVRERGSNGSALVFFDPDASPGELAVRGPGGRKDGDFAWDKQKQGEILAAYYYGYVIGHLPGGMLADYFGGKIVFAVGIFVSSLLSILTPASAWAGDYVLFANRVAQGAVGGMVISVAATGALCSTSVRWPLTFYVFGGIGLLWCLPWWLLAADSPAQHRNIDPAERRYIEATIQSSAKQKLPVPWRSLLSTPAIWALVVYLMASDITLYLLLSSLPLYIADILHFDVESKSGAGYSALLHAGLLVPAVALVVVALVGCDSAAIVASLAFGGFCMAAHCSAFYMNMQAIAPNFAGTLVGFVNTFASLSLMSSELSPMKMYVVSYHLWQVEAASHLVHTVEPTRASWHLVFYMTAAVAAAGYVLYAVFTTAEEQPWNVPSTENEATAKNDKGVVNTAFDGDDSLFNSRRSRL
ncbi:sialin-like [Schistocerca serialis cubense]|uniref:sialin-like n=1 Tax=Schistocerca serialis cubense TaxID=2023355 RepID=UPI00214EB446|nr:sialin-like [Schistocerca serialis cubense]